MPLDQAHHRRQPVEDGALLRVLYEGKDALAGRVARRPAVAHRRHHTLEQGLQPVLQNLGIQVRGGDELPDLGPHVVGQPGDGGELQAVRDLMQADPQPEVRRVHVHPPLGLDDVRCHQKQLSTTRPERVVLAEHPRGHKGEDRPGLYAGRPRADRHGEGTGWLVLPLLQPLDQRREHGRHPCAVDVDPVGSIDHAQRRRRRVGGHPGQFPDMHLRHVGSRAQFGDSRGGLLEGDLRAGADQPPAGSRCQIPIDHRTHCWSASCAARALRSSLAAMLTRSRLMPPRYAGRLRRPHDSLPGRVVIGSRSRQGRSPPRPRRPRPETGRPTGPGRPEGRTRATGRRLSGPRRPTH